MYKRVINVFWAGYARWLLKLASNSMKSYTKLKYAGKLLDDFHLLYSSVSWGECYHFFPLEQLLGFFFFRFHDFLSNISSFFETACICVYISLQTLWMIEATEEPGSTQWIASASLISGLLWSLIASQPLSHEPGTTATSCLVKLSSINLNPVVFSIVSTFLLFTDKNLLSNCDMNVSNF